MKPNRPKLSVEPLEERAVPAVFGAPWPDAGHLTMSFVPDGTATLNGSSQLHQTLNQAASTAVWKREILRGVQSWLDAANVNIGLVSDGSQALGAVGAVQSDSRFGDIRVSAAGFSLNSQANASPFHWTGTTLGGDLTFNAATTFQLNTSGNGFDLYSVSLHEVGHILGLGHSSKSDSIMGEAYQAHAGLGASDIAAIRELYGPRVADAWDLAAGAAGNSTPATATPLANNLLNSQISAVGELTTVGDVDVYRFNVPPLSILSPVSVRLKAGGLSLLTSQITVTTSSGQVVGSATSLDPLSNDLSVQFNAPLLGGQYFVKVQKSQNEFAIGSYKLAIDLGALGGLAPILNLPIVLLDGNSNDPPLTGLLLPTMNPDGSDKRFDYFHNAAIEGANDTDSFRIVAPNLPMQSLNVLVWAGAQSSLNPHIRLFDSQGVEMAAQILANESGLMSVRIAGVVAGASYYLNVSARTPGSVGKYALAADFNHLPPPAYSTVAMATVTPPASQSASMLIDASGFFQFALAADSLGGNGTVRMTVRNAAGAVVFTLDAIVGQPRTTVNRFLATGSYQIELANLGTGSIGATLQRLTISEPVGTYKTNTGTTADNSAPPPPEITSDTTTRRKLLTEIYEF